MKHVALTLAAFALPPAASAQLADDGLVGATRAVTLAERLLSARAIEVYLKPRGDSVVYEIELVRGTVLHRVVIEARSGKLVSSERPRIENWLRGWFDSERLRYGGRSGPLAARLALLEKQSGGAVQTVEFEMRAGRAVYDIELATAAGIGEVDIDALTGQRIELANDD